MFWRACRKLAVRPEGRRRPAESLAWTRAHELYQRTDYAGSVEVLSGSGEQDAAAFLLMGQDYFMLAQL